MRPVAFALLAAGLAAVAVAQPPQPRPLAHPDTVYAVAFSPDGKTVATGCFDKAVRLWDAGSGTPLRAFGGKTGHQNLVVSVAFSADGTQLATTSTDNTARVWDLPTVTPLAERAHARPLTRLAVSPDGKTFAAAGLSPIRLWDAADPKANRQLAAHDGPLVGMQYTANGATLVTLGADRVLTYRSAADGKELGRVGVGGGTPTGLWVSPATGVPFTAAADGTARAWPAAPPPAPKPFAAPPAKPTGGVLTADGAQLFVALDDQSVRVWNTATGEAKGVLEKLPPGDVAVAVHPTNGTVAAASASGKVILTGPDGKPRGALAIKPPPAAVAFHPTEPKLYSVSPTGVVESWPLPKADEKEPKEAKPLSSRPTAKSAARAALLPQANQAVVIDADGAAAVWDTTDGKEAKEVRKLGAVGGRPNAVAVSRDGTTVAAAGRTALKVWALADGKEVAAFPGLPAPVEALALNADKSRLAVSAGDGTVTVYALPGGHAEQFVAHGGRVPAVAFHPTQPVLYTAGQDGAIKATPLLAPRVVADAARFGGPLTGFANGTSLLTAGTGEGVTKANPANLTTEATYGKAKGVTAVAANRTNTLVAVAEAGGTVTVFNAANPAESHAFKAPARVTDLAFHPTRPHLAGALADGRAMAWLVLFDPADAKAEDRRFGATLQDVPHPKAGAVAFTPDGLTLLTGGDLTVRSWRAIDDGARLTLTHPSIVNAAAFDRTGTLLATAGQDGVVRVYDLAKPAGTAPKEIKAHVPAAPATPQPVYAVLFTPDGKQVISASFDKSIKVHEVADGKLAREVKPAADKGPGHSDAVYALALSPDGKALASGSADRTVKLWNPATGELVREFKNTVDPKLKDVAHPGYVQGLKFTADGTKLVTVGTAPKNRGYLAVWAVADGKQVSGQELDLGPIHAVDVRADGLTVLGCAARGRGQTAADAVLLPLPK